MFRKYFHKRSSLFIFTTLFSFLLITLYIYSNFILEKDSNASSNDSGRSESHSTNATEIIEASESSQIKYRLETETIGSSTEEVLSETSALIGFELPLISHEVTVTQCYSEKHEAIDFFAPGYPDVIAVDSGVVTFAGCFGACPYTGEEIGGTSLARTIVVEHENGYSSVYGHLNDIYITKGDTVNKGAKIGQMGQSGDVVGGKHLHFMVIEGLETWTAVDPTPFFAESLCSDTSEWIFER